MVGHPAACKKGGPMTAFFQIYLMWLVRFSLEETASMYR
jgi:hypothetical protein